MDAKLRRLTRFILARDGATAMEFAFIMPILFVLTIGLIEVGLMLFDFHRAGEAMRAAVRAFEVGPAAVSFDTLPMTCPGGANCDSARIIAVAADINAMFPQVVEENNLQITYDQSGLGIFDAGGVVTPVITVSIVNVQHDFFILNALIPGIPDSFAFPMRTPEQ